MHSLNYLSVVRFSGADAGEFLQNQLSADVLALANGESTFACYCEPKGRVLALMLVCRSDDSYLTILSTSLAESVVSRLKIYVMRSRVDIETLDDHDLFGVSTDSVPGVPPTSIPAIPLPGSSHWFLVTGPDTNTDIDTTLPDDWKMSELQRGITWLCPQTSGQFLPQMLGFDQLGAVNFRKGCYPGQEIVARTRYLGKVKRHPRVLQVGTVPCPDPMEKIRILTDGNDYEAVAVDCGSSSGHSCIVVVTRMDPELTAVQIEFQEKILPVL